MKTKSFRFFFALAFLLLIFSFDLPVGWHIAGSAPAQYDMGTDPGAGMNGSNAATIRSKEKKIKGFGTLMQSVEPGKYWGKRLRMSGYMKSKNVKGCASFWLRIDGFGTRRPLGFDNMADRFIKGTTEWTKYEIVLDVPDTTAHIAYGALLHGTGQIWFDDLKFEVVGDSVPVTGIRSDKPKNLNFEESK